MFSPEFKIAVAKLMYAHGDSEEPDPRAVDCMCGLIQIQMEKEIEEAKKIAETKGSFDADCFVVANRYNRTKYKVVKELLGRKKAVEEALRIEL